MKDIVKRQIEFFGHVIRKEELENLVVTGFNIHRREKSQMTSKRDTSELSAKDEGNDAHITDPPCLQERCLVTVVQIAVYVNMIWHTMMMIVTYYHHTPTYNILSHTQWATIHGICSKSPKLLSRLTTKTKLIGK